MSEQTSSKLGFSLVEQDQVNWLKTDISVSILHPDDGGFGLRSCMCPFEDLDRGSPCQIWSSILLRCVVIFNPW